MLSCETQLIEFIGNLVNNMQKGSQTDILVMDLSQALDKVGHKRLARKLEYYGISGKTNKWIRSFSAGRNQTVVLDGEKSDPVEVTSGVPQGSVPRPCLFLFYINDLPLNLKSTVRLFADDTIAYLTIRNNKDAAVLQEDLDKLAAWEEKWLMEFHPKKCQVLNDTRNRKSVEFEYKLHGQILEKVTYAKYLSVTITDDLRWNQHISNITTKANNTLSFLKRNIHVSSPKLKSQVYNTQVRPTLKYAATVWDPYTERNINKVEMVQRRAARYVSNRYNNTSSVTCMLKALGWTPLSVWREIQRLAMLYKINHGLVAIDKQNFIQPVSKPTRHAHKDGYMIPQSSSDYHLYYFFPRTVRL